MSDATSIACLLPVRGRPARTLEVADRLMATAGDVHAVWVAVGAAPEQATLAALGARGWVVVGDPSPRLTYWEALALGTAATASELVACLANDLDPQTDWLRIALAAYRARFDMGPGLMGFAGDGHGAHHSCHFLIARALLEQLGGWPTHYDHNFGDTELCERAQALGRYGKTTHAVLRHAHPGRDGAVPDDAVYAEGRARWDRDRATYLQRRPMWIS